MKIVYSKRFLEHRAPNRPECAERLTAIIDYLKKKGFSKKDFVEPTPAKEKDLLLVHKQELLDELKLRSKRELSTPDNPFNKNTYQIALLSAGAALDAARLSEKEFAFALSRPPGHHAGIRTFGGFCYLNNIAFAVRKIQKEKDIERVLIVDFDVHLGQGTVEIFKGDSSVFYLSFHQSPQTIYPWKSFGENSENIKKIAFSPGITDEEYLLKFKEETQRAFKQFKPDLIGVSAGFDIFYRDSIVANKLQIKKPKTFHQIGSIIKKLKKPAFGVLEGGYTLETLGSLAYQFLKPLY